MLAASEHGLKAGSGRAVIERQDGNWWEGCGVGVRTAFSWCLAIGKMFLMCSCKLCAYYLN